MSAENYMTAVAYKMAFPENYKYVYSGNTMEELASVIGADATTLANTVAKFNTYAETGVDVEFGRSAESMKAFPAEGPYYAVKMVPQMLNTQGGARRNENAEVISTEGTPIPHLYSAGEFVGICSLHDQGGSNIAECIIFGQIAGQNAAAAKEALPAGLVTDVMDNAKYVPGMPGKIIEAQSTEVDVIGGASLTSTAIKNAVADALAKAK